MHEQLGGRLRASGFIRVHGHLASPSFVEKHTRIGP
jgi:hypothetical protein